jgi:hypothetical protein
MQGSIYWNIPPPGGIYDEVIWGTKCEKGKRKRGNVKETGRKGTQIRKNAKEKRKRELKR